jgi:alkanesulfonate monooxygenase SsuD/methylene tetrahydromethanopterin reductase-like flavin-dependent oxidoreductase (luciferase family)
MGEVHLARNPSEKSVQFGLFVAQVYPWNKMVEYAQLAETLGFDSLWVADHFVNPFQPETPWYECWTTLAGLAAATKEIRLGPMVTHIVYRNPALLARQAMTVDHISGGRLEIGIGAGGSRHCHEMTGVPFWKPKERSERFHEAVKILDQLLRQEVSSFEGSYYQFTDAQMRPSPLQKPRPPITVAARGLKALKLAVLYGEGWNHIRPVEDLSPEEALTFARGRNEKLTAISAEYGRDPKTIKRSVSMGFTSEKPFSSMESLRDYIGRYSEIGFSEFIFGYTPGFEQFEGLFITKQEQLENIAAEIIEN